MYRYIQELLQNILRESSRSKVKPKKGKSAGNSFQGSKKASVKPEVLAPVGTKRREIENSPDFIQLKHTYDLLMKRFSNQTIGRTLSSVKSVKQINNKDIEREIQNLFLPELFNNKSKTVTPTLEEFPLPNELKKPAQKLSIGWSGQVTKSSFQPQVEVALYPRDITSALLIYPEIEDNFREVSKPPHKRKKRRGPRQSFTARKIKFFGDKTLLRQFEKPSINIPKVCKINLQKQLGEKEDNSGSSENDSFNQVSYDFIKENESPVVMESSPDEVNITEKLTTSQNSVKNKLVPLSKKVSNTFISFTSMINENDNKQADQSETTNLSGTSLGKEEPLKTENQGIREISTEGSSVDLSDNAILTTNTVGPSEISELNKYSSKGQVKCSKDIITQKLSHLNYELGANVLSLPETTSSEMAEEKRISPTLSNVSKNPSNLSQESNILKPLHSNDEVEASLSNMKSPKSTMVKRICPPSEIVKTPIKIPNDKGKTNHSTEEVIDMEEEWNTISRVLFHKPSASCVNSNTSTPCTVENQLLSERSRLFPSDETAKFVRPDRNKCGHSDSHNLFDDLKNEKEAQMNNILNKTKTLQTKVEQENFVCSKLSGLSSFKCSIKSKTDIEEQRNCEKKDHLATKEFNINNLQTDECINMKHLLEPGKTQYTHSIINNATGIQVADINNSVLNVPLKNDAELVEKNDSFQAEGAHNFSKKMRQRDVKNWHLKSTIPTQEIKTTSLDVLKRFPKNQKTSRSIDNVPESMDYKGCSITCPVGKNHKGYSVFKEGSSNNKTVNEVLKNQGSFAHDRKPNQLTEKFKSNDERSRSIRNSTLLKKSNKVTKLFPRKNEDIKKYITSQNVKNMCSEKSTNLDRQKSRSLDCMAGNCGLNQCTAKKRITEQNSNNKTNVKKNSSWTNLNEKKTNIFYAKHKLCKSVEKLADITKSTKKRLDTFVTKPIQTNNSGSNLQRKLYTKNEFKCLEILSSLKKYGEEKKDTTASNMKLVNNLISVKKKCQSKGSNKKPLDRLISKGKKEGVNFRFSMQNRSFCTMKNRPCKITKNANFINQQLSRMSTNKYSSVYKGSSSNMHDLTGLNFNQFGAEYFTNKGKTFPSNHVNENKYNRKVSFKTKRKLEKYKTKGKVKTREQIQSNENDGSVEVLFSRQEKNGKLVEYSNQDKTEGFTPGKYSQKGGSVYDIEPIMISKDLPQTPFNLGGPPVDKRQRWKSKQDRIVSWKLLTSKLHPQEPKLISKLKTVIKAHSIPKVSNLKKNNDLVPNFSEQPKTNSKNLGQTRLIQELDSIIKKEMEYTRASAFKWNQTNLSNNSKLDNTNASKGFCQKKTDTLDLNLHFNNYKINNKNNSLSPGSKTGNVIKSTFTAKQKEFNNIKSKTIHKNKSSSIQNIKRPTYEIMKAVPNKYCNDGVQTMKNNYNLNLLAKRHSSLLVKQLSPVYNEKRAKTATLAEKTAPLTSYYFDTDSLSSMKQPKLQVKFQPEVKSIKTEQPKINENKKENKTLKPNIFVPSNKLKDLLDIHVGFQHKKVSTIESTSRLKEPIVTSKYKLVEDVECLKKSAELMPIDTMVKQIIDRKISLPPLNAGKSTGDKRHTEKSQEKSPLKANITQRRSQRKSQFFEGKQRKTSISSTNVNKLNNIRKSKSEVTFSTKLEHKPLIFEHFENWFTNFNKSVKPTTYSALAISQGKGTTKNNTNYKENGEVGQPSLTKTSSNNHSNSRNNSPFASQYKSLQASKAISKVWEPKEFSEKMLSVNKRQATPINKTSFATQNGMVKKHNKVLQPSNIAQSKNQGKVLATGTTVNKTPFVTNNGLVKSNIQLVQPTNIAKNKSQKKAFATGTTAEKTPFVTKRGVVKSQSQEVQPTNIPKNKSEKTFRTTGTIVSKTPFVTTSGIVKNHSQVVQHRNISQRNNEAQVFATKKSTKKLLKEPLQHLSHSSNGKNCDEHFERGNINVILTSPEEKRLRNKVSLINDFKFLLEKQIKQRKELTGSRCVRIGAVPNLTETTCDKRGMKQYLGKEVGKGKSSTDLCSSTQENAKPNIRVTEKTKSSLFGLNRKPWDFSDEFDISCMI